MNKKKKKQNGFTIVELVIVIAVIGILAAILIPTFSNLVKKAKQSADQQLVYHINEAVVANEVDNLAKGKNGTEATMYDTLQALENDYGFTIEKMTPRSGNDIIWDSTTNRFALVAKDGTIVYDDPNKPSDMTNKAKMWRITEAGETLGDGYSHYLTAGWSGEVPTVSTGLDVGDNDDITAVTYARTGSAQNVVIRTNSANTSLTIDAASDTVKHYGTVGSLNIVAVANASYHEYGKAAFAEIATGRIVLESESEVEHIHLTATEGNFNDITVAKASDVEMPEFSRDPVEIPAEGKLVVALQDGTDKDEEKDYVWLTAVGIYEQVTVSDSKDDAKNNYAATSTTASEEQKTAAQQIANNITFNEGGVDYKVTATKDGDGWTYEVVDQNGTVSDDYSASKDTTQNTVNVQTTGETPEAVETTKENGLSEAAKEEKQTELVNEAKAPEMADKLEENIDAVVYNLTTKVYYNNLYTAIDEVPANTKQTLVLLKDISNASNENYEIPANKVIVLDLNGKVINTVAPDDSTAYTIVNKGTLTIKDNTDTKKNGSGTGKITSSAVKPDMQDVPGYASNTITNLGNLTIESGIIENRGAGYACFAIDNQTNGNLYTPVLTINGGKMLQESQYHYAVRMFCNSTTKANTCVINGGVIEGGYAFWMQTPNNNANMASLTINGGTFIAHDGYAVYFGGSGSTADGRNYSNTSIVFNGGTLNRVMVGAIPSNTNAPIKFEINGGTITELKLGDNVVPTIKEGWSVTE